MSTAEDFKPGDVVRLRSGGPEMTIASINSGSARPMAECFWFRLIGAEEKKQDLEKEFIPVVVLKKANSSGTV